MFFIAKGDPILITVDYLKTTLKLKEYRKLTQAVQFYKEFYKDSVAFSVKIAIVFSTIAKRTIFNSSQIDNQCNFYSAQ